MILGVELRVGFVEHFVGFVSSVSGCTHEMDSRRIVLVWTLHRVLGRLSAREMILSRVR